MMTTAAELRDQGHGNNISYSRKVFIPLTKLCRDSCHYCTFAAQPGYASAPRRRIWSRRTCWRSLGPVRAPAAAKRCSRSATSRSCVTLLLRARRSPLGRYATTLDYLAAMAALVVEETGLLPHLNPGVMSRDEMMLRKVSVSQGIMLETGRRNGWRRRADRHFGSPDKAPAVRLATIGAAGEAAIPFTSGILIGIGETRRERIEALPGAPRALHRRHGHIQEIIIQNFRAKPAHPHGAVAGT